MRDVVSAAATAAKSVVDNAQRLGLTWGLRPGTVSSTSKTLKVRLDGPDEDTQYQVINLTSGPVILGTRVQVLMLPDSMYIVGFPGGAKSLDPGVFADPTVSAAVTAETVINVTQPMLFTAGRAFSVEYSWWHQATIATNGVIRIRRGSTTAGTTLAGCRFVANTGAAYHLFDKNYFTNDNTTDITDTVCLTVTVPTGTITLSASVDTPRSIRILDVGTAAQYASWSSM